MLLKKIHHLKKKIKTHISNIDLLEVVVEDNNDIRQEINELNKRLKEKDEEVQLLHKRTVALEKLNIAYSKDVVLLSQAVVEQYEVLSSLTNREMILYSDELFDLEQDKIKKKKKIVH
tara:strand:- start:239 stop:592 length:354 start_codon:yes stop_codon:yes gene_type:complete